MNRDKTDGSASLDVARHKPLTARCQARRLGWLAALAISATGVLTVPCTSSAGDLKIDGQWRSGIITVDGGESEWDGLTTYVADLKGTLGVLNDSEYVYVCVATQSQDFMPQILMSGLTVWFDGEGGKDKVFGIRFPLQQFPSRPQSPPGMGERGGQTRPDLAALFQRIDSTATEFAVVGKDGEAIQTFRVGGQGDIAVKMAYHDERLVYELRVPIGVTGGHLYAIGGTLGKKIGIGLTTPEMSAPSRGGPGGSGFPGGGGPPGGGMGGGGMGPGGGGPGGGMGPGGGGQRPSLPQPLKMWAKVTLASTPPATLTGETEETK